MNCSVEDSIYASGESQNVKSKMYVPGVGKLIEMFFYVWFLAILGFLFNKTFSHVSKLK